MMRDGMQYDPMKGLDLGLGHTVTSPSKSENRAFSKAIFSPHL